MDAEHCVWFCVYYSIYLFVNLLIDFFTLIKNKWEIMIRFLDKEYISPKK